jgi:hypothetical protein
MGKPLIDMTGKRYGRLTVLSRVPATLHGAKWLCRCDCGKEAVVQGWKMRSAHTRSCGCLHRDTCIERSTSHGYAQRQNQSVEYRVWCWMKQRCYDPKCHAFNAYGGRGITVCERWLRDFPTFLADMGERPSPEHSIERNDVNGNYTPDNCRWATRVEQHRNKRNTRWLEAFGERRSIPEWAERTGLPMRLIVDRVAMGWEPEKALTYPKRPMSPRRHPFPPKRPEAPSVDVPPGCMASAKFLNRSS